jgi:two-component system nitrogen regulation response regulator NtrX
VKPFTEERLVRVVQLAKNYYALQRENNELRRKIRPRTPLIGNSAHTNAVKAAIERLAPTASRVLITGPSGVGKELIAEEIHYKSKRRNESFVVFSPVNVTPDRAIVELFGQAGNGRGEQRVIGALERAHFGSVYIDEITTMSLEMQHMLLRFLQDQTVAKPGQNRLTKLDVRVMSSTSHDIEKAIRDGKLLRDLYYRLNVMPVQVPALSERREDIPALCVYYLKTIAENNGLAKRQIADDAMMVLQAYNWPGNVRQLRNVMEWLLIMAPYHAQGKISADMLPPEVATGSVQIMQPETNVDLMSMSLREAREVFERQYLLAQMQRFSNNISKTSSFVGMERSALHRKLKSLNIHSDHQHHDEKEGELIEETQPA